MLRVSAPAASNPARRPASISPMRLTIAIRPSDRIMFTNRATTTKTVMYCGLVNSLTISAWENECACHSAVNAAGSDRIAKMNACNGG